MKGLIFNLLDSMARQSGCADEAWDLVMEFVASETDHDAQSDTCLSCFDGGPSLLSLEPPAEGMMQCFGSEGASISESLSEFPEMAVAEADDWIADSIPALIDPDYVMPRMASSEGFSHDLMGLLEQLLAEALTGDDDDEDGDEPTAFTASILRRTSS